GGVAHQLSARRGSTCAVSRDHGLSCWMPGGPARRIAAVDPARVAVGPGLDGCMLDFEGAGSCWGGTSTAGGSSLEPRAVEGLPPSRDVGVGDGSACVLGRDGLVRCWGSNEGQRPGLPSSVAEQPTPTVVPDLPNRILQLAVGDASTCVLEDGGAVWCWGGNTEGQLGRG